MTAEMNELYGATDRLDLPALHPAELAPPHGAYLVVLLEGDPVAGGGLRGMNHQVAEIKRMYVRPDRRARGIGAVLLGGLEEEGVRLGYRAVRLDTGPRQPHALRLYRSAGYQEVPRYNDNPYACFWGEKELDVSGANAGR
jgi:GNAT superfamily N-acetyltransferase